MIKKSLGGWLTKSINQKSHSPWSGLLEGKRERKKGDKKEKNKRGGKKEHKTLHEADLP